MGLMVINGAGAGGFSPISVWGVIVDGVRRGTTSPRTRSCCSAGSFCFNLALSVVAFVSSAAASCSAAASRPTSPASERALVAVRERPGSRRRRG